ncbi:MAG: hypothetical protein IPN86_12295 [Saprospiraceae bacterium]|jgi:hypothetical protein|nr:hypothetical protein [Saprospiraceae bacterium]
MRSLLNVLMPDPIKGLVKSVTETKGGQWVQKKELRMIESEIKKSRSLHPRATTARFY